MHDYLTTRELADLLRIKERKVYDLAASGAVPCSRAMGKLLFSRKAIEAWLAAGETGEASPARTAKPAVVLGSHDPLLDWALRQSRCGLATAFDSSLDGLERFAADGGCACGLHVHDAATGNWNEPVVAARFAGEPVVLLQWAGRARGLIIAPERAEAIRGLHDLAGHRVVPRQPEAGSQLLLDHLLSEAAIDSASIHWTTPALSEQDAALHVREGKADAAFGLASVAAATGLGFVETTRERFDLLVDRHAWFEPPLRQLIAFCRTEAFATRAEELGGYDLVGQFSVHFNGAP